MRKEKKRSKKNLFRYIACAAFLALMCFLTPAGVCAKEEDSLTEVQMEGTITANSSLNVRSGPGTKYEVIASVNGGELVEITGETDNGWYRIRLDEEGKTGYVSCKYVEPAELQPEDGEETEEEEEKEEGEPEEGYRGLNQSPYVKKMAALLAGIVIVLILLLLTLRGLRRDEEEEEDDGYPDGDEEDDGYADDDADTEDGGIEDDEEENEDEDEEDDVEDRPRRGGGKKKAKKPDSHVKTAKKSEKKSYYLREEDYRVEIDPSFFEDKEPIEQPDMVTGYLERKRLEEEMGEASKQKELDQAMEKLNELQREIERLKRKE